MRVIDPANFAFGRTFACLDRMFSRRTQRQGKYARNPTHCVGGVKPLENWARLVDKLREICAVVRGSRVSGDECSAVAQKSTQRYW